MAIYGFVYGDVFSFYIYASSAQSTSNNVHVLYCMYIQMIRLLIAVYTTVSVWMRGSDGEYASQMPNMLRCSKIVVGERRHRHLRQLVFSFVFVSSCRMFISLRWSSSSCRLPTAFTALTQTHAHTSRERAFPNRNHGCVVRRLCFVVVAAIFVVSCFTLPFLHSSTSTCSLYPIWQQQ